MSIETVTQKSETPNKPATIRDVALAVGVSPMTVSKVMNGNGNISAGTREAVLSAAEKLNYRPHLGAQGMKSRRSRVIGAIVQNVPENPHSHPLAWEFMIGINYGLEQAGYITSLIRLNDVLQDGEVLVSALKCHLLDGAIAVAGFPKGSEEKIQKMMPHCVWLDSNKWNEECCIRRDEVYAGYVTTRALLEAGYRKIIYIGHPPRVADHYSAQQRVDGVHQAIAEAQAELVEISSFQLEQNSDAVAAVINQLKSDVGLIVSEAYALHALSYRFLYQGLRPGIDFAMTCCDDTFHGNGMEWPGLAHVTFDRYSMGVQAAHMIVQRIENPDAKCPSQIIRGQWSPGRTVMPLK